MAPRKKYTEARTAGVAGETVVGLFADQSERHAAAGDEPAEGAIGEGEEVRIPLMEEQVQVEKTPVVREEVSVRKRQVQDTKGASRRRYAARRPESKVRATRG